MSKTQEKMSKTQEKRLQLFMYLLLYIFKILKKYNNNMMGKDKQNSGKDKQNSGQDCNYLCTYLYIFF